MSIYRRISSAVLALFFILSLLFVTGCTKYASQKDLDGLRESKEAAISAEKELEQVTSTRKTMEKELDAKKKELQEAESELKIVKGQ